MTSTDQQVDVLVVHTSNELYGTDRVLLDVLQTVPEHLSMLTLLPSDAAGDGPKLTTVLAERGHAHEVVDLPILRRRNLVSARVVRLLPEMLRLVRLIRQLNPRIVYCSNSSCMLVAIAARMAGIEKVVLHCQEVWGDRERLVLGVLGRAAHSIVCVSHSVGASMPEALSDRVSVIVNAVEPPFSGEPPRPAAPREGLTFLVASRWSPRKGYEPLLAAWNLVGDPTARLIVLGGAPRLGTAADVPAMVGQLHAPESVTVVGEVASIWEHLVAADVVIVPSVLPEGFGLVAAEAFAAGRPVIASDVPGLNELVTDGVTGILVRPDDAAALARAIESFSPERVRSMGAAARSTYVERFSMPRFTDEFRELWASIAVSREDART